MFNSQNLKTVLRLCILSVLTISLWYFSGKASTQNHAQAGVQIPISTVQLSPTNGTVAVELKCANAELSAPNKIEEFPCEVINNTNKRISAVAVTYTITLVKDGVTTAHTEALTLDTFIHPDLREERKDNLIPPRGERPFRPLPTSFDDAVVKAISMRVDYVEFEDNSSLGPNRAGSRIITGIRGGAAKYRNWLVEKYIVSGKSINVITSLIQDDEIPESELGIENDDQRQGAIIYRNYLRRSYESKGVDGLAEFLERKISVKNNK